MVVMLGPTPRSPCGESEAGASTAFLDAVDAARSSTTILIACKKSRMSGFGPCLQGHASTWT